MSTTLIMSSSPMGIQATKLFQEAFNRAELNEAQAKRLNDRGAEFAQSVADVINKLSALQPLQNWEERNGIIYFSVTSDGTTGFEWIARLQEKGFNFGGHVKSVLRSLDFKETCGVTSKIAVLKGSMFKNNARIVRKIRTTASGLGLTQPSAEITCLIREKFTDEQLNAMGLWWIVVMHEPIKDFSDELSLLAVSRGNGNCLLSACGGRPKSKFSHGHGFAFVDCDD